MTLYAKFENTVENNNCLEISFSEDKKLLSFKIIKDGKDLEIHFDNENNINEVFFFNPFKTEYKISGKRKEIDLNTYSTYAPTIEKIKFILREKNSFITTNELAKAVQVYEPKIPLDIIKNKFCKHISLYTNRGHIKTVLCPNNDKEILIGLPHFQ